VSQFHSGLSFNNKTIPQSLKPSPKPPIGHRVFGLGRPTEDAWGGNKSLSQRRTYWWLGCNGNASAESLHVWPWQSPLVCPCIKSGQRTWITQSILNAYNPRLLVSFQRVQQRRKYFLTCT